MVRVSRLAARWWWECGALLVAYGVKFTTFANITGSVGAAEQSSTIALPAPASKTITASGGRTGGNSNNLGLNGLTGFTNTFSTPFTLTLGSSGSGGSGGSRAGGTAVGATNAFASLDFCDSIFGGGRARGQAPSSNGGGGVFGVGFGGNAVGKDDGGAGYSLTFDGTLRAFCCGGGGGGSALGVKGLGGSAHGVKTGGDGGSAANGSAATPNTGSGGGGGGAGSGSATTGGASGTGLVMIRYVIG